VYPQQITPTTLDVIVRHIVLRVQKVLLFKVLLLKGQDGQIYKDHVCNFALCHLLHVDG
jgi:hypothetical protein